MEKLKRMISTLLISCLLLTVFPPSAFGAGDADGGAPQLLTLTVMDKEGNEVSLLEKNPIVAIGDDYVFSMTFSNPGKIRKAYVTSTKDSKTEYLEAVWDGSAFKTQGPFTGDASYIPGKIGVEYIENVEFVEIRAGVDLSNAEQELKDQTVVEIRSSSQTNPDAVAATIDISKLLGAEMEVAVEVVFDSIDASTDTTLLNNWLGAYKDLESLRSFVIGNSDYELYLDYSDTSTYAMILRDVTGSKYYKMICSKADENYDSLPSLVSSLDAINTVSSLTYDYLNIQNSADELRQQVSEKDDILDEVKENLYEDIDAYEKDRQLFSLAMAVIPAVTAATGGTMTAPTLLFGALLSAINAAADSFWEYRVGMITEYDEPLDTEFTCATPLTRKLLTNGELTQGGTYCLANSSPSSFTMNSISVDLCLHGHSCSITNNGGSLTIHDCAYQEPESVEASNVYLNALGNVKSAGGIVDFDHCRGALTMTNNGFATAYGGQIDAVSSEDSEVYVYSTHITGHVENKNGSLTLEKVSAPRLTNTAGTVDVLSSVIGQGVGSIGVTNDENGTVTITNSTVFGYENAEKGGNRDQPAIKNISGKLTIIGGKIVSSGRSSGVAIYNSGVAEILSGEIIGSGSEGDGACISNRGTLTLQSGTFIGTVGNSGDGEIIINDGTFQTIGTANVANQTANGTVTINHGTFRASGGENIVTSTGNTNYLPETTINGGAFYADGESCIRNQALIVGDTVMYPVTDIMGGTFFSDNKDAVYNSGKMEIRGGFFYTNYGDDSSLSYDAGCVRNGERNKDCGILSINGGTFINEGGAYCVLTPNTYGLTISNGTFLSSGDGIHGGTCNMEITAKSDIQIYANYKAETSFYKVLDTGISLYETPVSLHVTPDANYGGKLMHYSSAISAEGTELSFSQAANLDISTSYLRLTGAEAADSAEIIDTPHLVPGMDVTWISNVKRTVIAIPDSTDIQARSAVICAAAYDNGRMTDVAFGRLDGGNILFEKKLTAGWKIFFFDPATAAPLREQITLK